MPEEMAVRVAEAAEVIVNGFTTFCLVEAMHVHASDEQLTEDLSAKFFVKADGSTVLAKRGKLTDREIAGISKFIKENYMEMYAAWAKRSENGFFIGETI